VTVLVGTSGWQYRDWRGTFYPPQIRVAVEPRRRRAPGCGDAGRRDRSPGAAGEQGRGVIPSRSVLNVLISFCFVRTG